MATLLRRQAILSVLDLDMDSTNTLYSPSGISSNLESRVARRAMPLAKSS